MSRKKDNHINIISTCQSRVDFSESNPVLSISIAADSDPNQTRIREALDRIGNAGGFEIAEPVHDQASGDKINAQAIEIGSISFQQMAGVLDSLEKLFQPGKHDVQLKLRAPDIEQKAIENARQENVDQANKVAESLSVRIRSVESESIGIKYGISDTCSIDELREFLAASPNLIVAVTIDRHYQTTRFIPLLYNLKLLIDNFNPALIKRQLRFLRFKRRFTRKASPGISGVVPGPADQSRKAVIFGHFSFPGGGGTFGDLAALDVVTEWLQELNIDYVVVSNGEDGADGVELSAVQPENFGVFIFVCGPWYSQGKIQTSLLQKFQHCLKIGVNLTTFERGNAGFDYLLSRDNIAERNVDIAFGNQVSELPVVGIVLVERQKIYGFKQRHQFIKSVIQSYVEGSTLAPIWLDTDASLNLMDLRTKDQFESIIKRTDLVITDRLHGAVLSLKNQVPVIAIDPIEGGGKVTAQIEALEWPILIPAENFSYKILHETILSCLDRDFQNDLRHSHHLAEKSIEKTHRRFNEAVQDDS